MSLFVSEFSGWPEPVDDMMLGSRFGSRSVVRGRDAKLNDPVVLDVVASGGLGAR